MSVWQSITWDIARAGGFTAYILLTLSVAVGLALTMQWQSPSKWPRLLNSELHNFITLIALIFTGMHVLAVWIDPLPALAGTKSLFPLSAIIDRSGWAWELSHSTSGSPSASVPGYVH